MSATTNTSKTTGMLRVALRGFWTGFRDLGRGFDWSYTPPKRSEDNGLGKYFAAVGGYMWRVVDKSGISKEGESAYAL